MSDTKGDATQNSASRDGAIDRVLEYLFMSSPASIESFQLTRLNAAANLRKELHEVFDELVEAEVQARLAQCVLARKGSENLAVAGSITIGSGANHNAQIAAARATIRLTNRSPTRSPSRVVTRRSAAADSAASSCIARFHSTGPDDSKHSSIKSRIRSRTVRPKNRPGRAIPAKLTIRPLITRSATATRTPRFRASLHLVATPATISKSSRATTTLLSFRRPNRNSIAI